MDAFRIEPLGPDHDRSGFSCRIEALDRYFREQVTQDMRHRTIDDCPTAALLVMKIVGIAETGQNQTVLDRVEPRLVAVQPCDGPDRGRKKEEAVSQPPRLPAITARPARDPRESAAALTRKPVQTKPSQEAMNAMAMDQSGRYSSVQSSSYAVRDRHAVY